jgi:hypothetical protein
VAMTVRGFDSPALQFNETSWAEYQKRSNGMGNVHGVWSGGAVTPGTGRTVDVAIIDGVLPGVWFVTDAATTAVAIAANAGTNRRIDYIVAEGDWTANTVTLKAVTGVAATAPTAPALTQNAGALWQMPLARVTVQGNATTIAAADVEPAAPKRLTFDRYVLAPNIDTMRGSATSWNSLGSLTVLDPGRPYRLQVSASVRFAKTETGGYMRVRAIDSDSAAVYGDGVSTFLGAGKAPAVISAQTSAVLSGTRRIRLEMLPAEVGAGEQLQVLDSQSNHFTVLVLPA